MICSVCVYVLKDIAFIYLFFSFVDYSILEAQCPTSQNQEPRVFFFLYLILSCYCGYVTGVEAGVGAGVIAGVVVGVPEGVDATEEPGVLSLYYRIPGPIRH